MLRLIAACLLLVIGLAESRVYAQSIYSQPGGELYAYVNGNDIYIRDKSYFAVQPLESRITHSYTYSTVSPTYFAPTPLSQSYAMVAVSPQRVAVAQMPVMPRFYPVRLRGAMWTTPTSNHPFLSRHAAIRHLVNDHGYTEDSLRGLSVAELNSLHSDAHEGVARAITTEVIVSKPAVTYYSAPQVFASGGCPGGVCPAPSRRFFRRNF